jgi:hypothetical protein
LGNTEVRWSFQKFWNLYFGPNRDPVVVPEILEFIFLNPQRFGGRSRKFGIFFWNKQRFGGRSRNSGIEDLNQTEILYQFQKFWNLYFGTNRDSVVVPEILESIFCNIQRFVFVSEILDSFF